MNRAVTIPDGMSCPPALQSEAYLPWSRGRGVDVWAMFVAAMNGDLETVRRFVEREPALASCEFEYLTPLHFALREGQPAVAQFLVKQGIDPLAGFSDPPVQMVRERGYNELGDWLEAYLRDRYRIVPEGEEIAAAIRAFDLSRVRALVDGDPALVHAADERGNQPIHWAALTRQIEVIDYLLAHGADIGAVRPDGARPIDLTNGDYHYRSWYRDLPVRGLQKHEVVIGYLMARGAYCDISVAARIGYFDRVKELLEADPGLVNRLPDYVTYYNGLPLRNAAAAGHMEVVKLLLEWGANPNEPEPGIAPFGGALHAAVGGRHFSIARLLLEHGANPNAMVESSGDVLFMARHAGAPEDLVSLIASLAGDRDKEIIAYEADAAVLSELLWVDPRAPVEHYLGRLIGEDLRPQLELIYRAQPDIFRRERMLAQAWWDKTTFRTAEQARWFLSRGFDPRLKNWLGITMLHRAAAKGLKDVAEVLLEYGADIDAVETEWSSTPVGWAARLGQMEMMEWLVERGADIRVPEDRPWAWPEEWVKRRKSG